MRIFSSVIPDAIILGPYLDKSMDRMVVNVQQGSHRKNMSYARFLMQEYLQRILDSNEHVDHINNDRHDDRIENLQILTPSENTRKTKGEIKYIEFICPECGELAKKKARHVRHNRKQGKTGPFCGKSCAAKYRVSL